jgi:hypothetical protein
MRYAQDARFWTTEIDVTKSRYEIEKYLEGVGANQIITVYDKETRTLKVRFLYEGHVYLVEERPLPCRPEPKKRNYEFITDIQRREAKDAKNLDQAVMQMGRRAKAYIELLIDNSQDGHPELLEAYRQLPGGGPTFQQMKGVAGLMDLLQNGDRLALPANTNSDFNEFTQED